MNRTLSVRARIERSDGGHRFTLDAAFEVPPGITILFGPSGAGKTTALGAISGLVRPAEGRIALADEPWFDARAGIDRPAHARRAALVFQRLALFPHLSALGNVEFGVPRERPRPDRRRRALELLERMKVAHVAARTPPTLSGGEAQRVALARAFAMEPAVLLLDEPFSALQADLRRELGEEVRRFVDEARLPALQVTHQLDEARAMGDRVIVLERGRVAAAGAPGVLP